MVSVVFLWSTRGQSTVGQPLCPSCNSDECKVVLSLYTTVEPIRYQTFYMLVPILSNANFGKPFTSTLIRNYNTVRIWSRNVKRIDSTVVLTVRRSGHAFDYSHTRTRTIWWYSHAYAFRSEQEQSRKTHRSLSTRVWYDVSASRDTHPLEFRPTHA